MIFNASAVEFLSRLGITVEIAEKAGQSELLINLADNTRSKIFALGISPLIKACRCNIQFARRDRGGKKMLVERHCRSSFFADIVLVFLAKPIREQPSAYIRDPLSLLSASNRRSRTSRVI